MKRVLIAIAGPPCSGKTTVGQILAESLSYPLLETDTLIEKAAGKSIPEIFSEDGQAEFRLIEKRIISEILDDHQIERAVIALGGGSLLDSETRSQVESNCIVFTLSAKPEELVSRNQGGRPLGETREALMKLLSSREQHYASLPGQIYTAGKTPEQLAVEINLLLRKEDHSRLSQ